MPEKNRKRQALIVPGQTIGILGGGQLGRMMIIEGRKMGYRFVTLDPGVDCPGAQVADRHIVAAYDDLRAARQFADQCDLIVYEFENIHPEVVEVLEKIKPLPQGSRLLKTTQHRLKEKKALQEAGVPVAPFREVNDYSGLEEAMGLLGVPTVLKTTTGGYDGKGQWILQSKVDLRQLPSELFKAGRQFVLEKFVPFEKEISVVVARSVYGEMAVFPPALNLHRNHILHMSISPAPISGQVIEQAEQWAKQIAESLQIVGLIAVEMFLMPDGRLFVNELAPRPHNSGHYTFDSCLTSQFEQFIRAVAGLALGPTTQISPAVMVNILGKHASAFHELFSGSRLPGFAKVHWYGKKEAKPGRKMGHVTVLADSITQAVGWAEEIGIWTSLTEQEKKIIYNGDYFKRKKVETS
ncbi:5-(carboxyamino)imidazole ribonucleotide synthase [Thermoactinomyces mirandus]|uniref:N5-carboxyaminoimidazole ribonucleotide synthase n=1 Tax=Thermoactinomyces mirandus TaxID=2756294 RepID=A0A7W2APK5_9BACL|nr:5-(carboxyamino)imidazole ribonucleotide synthase [Thermoactinomyces mirandus]MBA4601054.1 5-(carboxyamino)imidazole ribonucleotide synthase [Thermoactinomyces mirandus]